MTAVGEITKLINEMETYLKVHGPTEDEADIQKLLEEKSKLERELIILKRRNLPEKPTIQESPNEEKGKHVMKSTYRQTDMEIFSYEDDSFKVVMKPKLNVLDHYQDFNIVFKTNEKQQPKIISTNLPCFIPFTIGKTTDLSKYTLEIVKRLECYLLRKHYIDAVQEKFSSMLNGSLKSSFAADFVDFSVSIDSEVSNMHGCVIFRLVYELEKTEANHVRVGFKGPPEFIASVVDDIMESSKAFRLHNLYDAFCQIFAPSV